MQPRTCVVIVNYKGAKDTEACLASLARSALPVSIVVVDNTPNDPELEASLARYPDVKFIRASENLGFGGGNNLGIEWAMKNIDCDYVFILNNDAVVQPDTIEKLVVAMEQHTDAAVVSPRIAFAEEPGKLWYGGGEVDWRRAGAFIPGFLGSADAEIAMLSRYVSFVSGCAIFIRKPVLEELQGFDRRFFMYGEDLELSLRIQKAGWRLWYESTSLVFHVAQGSQGNREKFIDRYDSKNPNLAFFVYHGTKSRFLNMHMHARGKNKALFYSRFPVYLSLKCLQWLIHGRTDALVALFNALRDYAKER